MLVASDGLRRLEGLVTSVSPRNPRWSPLRPPFSPQLRPTGPLTRPITGFGRVIGRHGLAQLRHQGGQLVAKGGQLVAKGGQHVGTGGKVVASEHAVGGTTRRLAPEGAPSNRRRRRAQAREQVPRVIGIADLQAHAVALGAWRDLHIPPERAL